MIIRHKKVILTLWVDPEVKAALKERADKEDRSMSQVATKSLRKSLGLQA